MKEESDVAAIYWYYCVGCDWEGPKTPGDAKRHGCPMCGERLERVNE